MPMMTPPPIVAASAKVLVPGKGYYDYFTASVAAIGADRIGMRISPYGAFNGTVSDPKMDAMYQPFETSMNTFLPAALATSNILSKDLTSSSVKTDLS